MSDGAGSKVYFWPSSPVAHAHRHGMCRPAGPDSQTSRLTGFPTKPESAMSKGHRL